MDPLDISKSRVPGIVSAADEGVLATLFVEASEHPALHHTWLDNIAGLCYSESAWALKDFALQYHAYASAFPTYLQMVIDKLEDPRHKQVLKYNLNEEKGELDAVNATILQEAGIDIESIAGISHPLLYQRFCFALGIRAKELAKASVSSLAWRDSLLNYLQETTSAAAVGAIGIGTESIVKLMYEKLLNGIRRHGELDRKDYVFFELHCIVDDQHAVDLNRIAVDLVRADSNNMEQMRQGLQKALDLRLQFWDYLHQRATSHPKSLQS